jgi:hypothetical protein
MELDNAPGAGIAAMKTNAAGLGRAPAALISKRSFLNQFNAYGVSNQPGSGLNTQLSHDFIFVRFRRAG